MQPHSTMETRVVQVLSGNGYSEEVWRCTLIPKVEMPCIPPVLDDKERGARMHKAQW